MSASDVMRSEGIRLLLDPTATNALTAMSDDLKKTGIKLKFGLAELAGAIVGDFFDHYFAQDRDALISRFFDSKAHMVDEMSRAKNSAEAAEVIRRMSNLIEEMNKRGADCRGLKPGRGRSTSPRRSAKLATKKQDSET